MKRRLTAWMTMLAAAGLFILPQAALVANAQVELMEDGSLFDPVWYRQEYPEVEGTVKIAAGKQSEETETGDTEENSAEQEEPSAGAADVMDDEDAASDSTEESKTGSSRENSKSGKDTAQTKLSSQSAGTSTSSKKVVNTETEDASWSAATEASEKKAVNAETEDAAEYETVETEDLSVTELYRLYQLYGQRAGQKAYDTSRVKGTMLEEVRKASNAFKEAKELECGPSWNVITSQIYDTETITVWDTEYLVSDQTNEKLQEAIDLFEEDGYEIGFVLVDITTGDAISYHAGAEIYSASVIKAPYIFSLLENGVEPTTDMYKAGNQSDNDAYQRIRNLNGNEVFAKWLEGTGVPEQQSRTRYIITTPLDLCRMFYKGTALLLGDEEYSDWARNTFTDSLNSAIALTVGGENGKTVYSKAGWIATEGDSIDNSYTNGAIVDGDYPYVVTIMSNSPGYIGLEYAKELMPILDQIHDEMVNPDKAGSRTETTASDISEFARNAQSSAQSQAAGRSQSSQMSGQSSSN